MGGGGAVGGGERFGVRVRGGRAGGGVHARADRTLPDEEKTINLASETRYLVRALVIRTLDLLTKERRQTRAVSVHPTVLELTLRR